MGEDKEQEDLTQRIQSMLSEALMFPENIKAAVLLLQKDGLVDAHYEGLQATCLGLLELARSLMLKDFLEEDEAEESSG